MITHCQLTGCPSLTNFNTIMALEGKIYREQNGRKTLCFTWQNTDFFAKLHTGIGWREVFKNLLQGKLPITSAKNEWQAIQRCHQYGISTMDLIAYGLEPSLNIAYQRSFLITRALTSVISLEDYCHHWQKNPPSLSHKKNLIKKVAELATQFHQAKMNHRDFYLCHFLLDTVKLQKGEIVLYLIDLHRVLIHRKQIPQRWLMKDLAGLFFSSINKGFNLRDWLRFINHYENYPWRQLSPQRKQMWRKITQQGLRLYQRRGDTLHQPS